VKQLPVSLLMQRFGTFWRQAGSDEADNKTAREQLNKKATYVFYPIITMELFAALSPGLLLLI